MGVKLHKFGKGVFILVASILAIVVLLVLALHMPFVLERVARFAEGQASTALDGELTIGQLEGSVFGTLTASEVELRGPDGERIATVKSVEITPHLLALGGRVVSLDIRADELVAYLERREDGSVNLVDLFRQQEQPSTTPSPVGFEIALAAENGTMLWRDEQAEAEEDALGELGAGYAADALRTAAGTIPTPDNIAHALPSSAALYGIDLGLEVEVDRESNVRLGIGALDAEAAIPNVTGSRALSVREVGVAMKGTEVSVTVARVDLDGWVELEAVRGWVDTADEMQFFVDADRLHVSDDAATRAAPDARLQTGVSVEVHVGGSAAAADVWLSAQPNGSDGSLTLAGEIGDWLPPSDDTRFDLVAVGEGLEPSRLTTLAAPLDRVSVWAEVSGRGITPDTMTLDGTVAARDIRIGDYHAHALYVEASMKDGDYAVPRAVVTSPYLSLALDGRLDADGAFDLEARAESTDAIADVSQRVLGRRVDTKADLRLQAEGRVDLAAAAPLDIVRQLSLDARWDVDRFSMEDVQIGDSDGRLEITVEPAGEARAVRWDARILARSVRTATIELENASIRSDGATRIGASSLDARQVLGDLRATVDADVRGLGAGDTRLDALHLLARVRPSSGRLEYDVRTSADGATFGEMRATAAGAALAGDVRLGPTLDWPGAVRALSARGDVSVTDFQSGGEGAGQLSARIDLAGPIDDIRGNVTASATELQLGGFAFRELGADVDFTGERYFQIDALGRQRDARPETIGISMRGRYARDLMDYTILDFALTTIGPAWEMDGELRADFGAGSFEFEDVTLTRDNADGTTQRVAVRGHYTTGRDQDLDVTIEDVRLDELAEQFGIPSLEPLAGAVSGRAKIAGTASAPTADFRLELRGLMWEQWGPFDVLLEGAYAERLLSLDTAQIDGYGARLLQAEASIPVQIDAAGSFEFLDRRPLNIAAEIPELPFATFREALPSLAEYNVSGQIAGRLDVRGPIRGPVMQATFGATNIEANGTADGTPYQFGPAEADMKLRYVPTRQADSGLRFDAALAFQEEPPLKVSAHVQAPLAEWITESIEGGEVDWMARIENAPIELSARSSQFDLRNVRVGPLQRADAEGFLDLAIDGRGTIARPVADITIGLDDFGWNRYRDIYVDVVSRLDPDQMEFREVALEWDNDDIFTARGRLPTPFAFAFGDAELSSLPLDFTAQLLPLPLRKFSAIDYTFAALKGEVSGFVRLDGTLSEPIAEGRFAAQDFEFMNKTRGSIALTVAAADNQVAVDALFCEGPRGILQARASLPVQLDVARWIESEEPVDPFVDGELQATLIGDDVPLASLLPRQILDSYLGEVEGKMDVDLAVSGSIENPQVVGALQIQNGQVFLPQYTRLFRDIQVDVEIGADGLAQIRRLYAADARGHASAQGQIRLDGIRPGQVDVEAVLDNVGTAGFADVSAFVSANIDVQGDMSGTAATARALVSELEVVIPQATATNLHPTSLDEDIVIAVERRRTSDLFAFDEEPTAVSRQPLARLSVEIEPNSWVRHPFAEVEIRGDLDVELRPDGALLGGEVQTVRGEAEIFGRRFIIEQGIVSFTGANPPNPLLQIEARYNYDRRVAASLGPATQGDPHAIVRVTGRSDDPQIRFFSDPDLPESDIIYTLLTNRAPNEADVGQSGASDVAAGAASGLAATFLEDQLAEVVPGFNVRVEAGDEGFADPTVEVGRYVGPFFFSVEARLGADYDESAAEVNIEYRLSRRWLIELEAGTRGTGETNIFWDIY